MDARSVRLSSGSWRFSPSGQLVAAVWPTTTPVMTAVSIVLSIKLPALVYHILPSATEVFSYGRVSRKLSANEQFFDGTQTVVGLLQTTQIIPTPVRAR